MSQSRCMVLHLIAVLLLSLLCSAPSHAQPSIKAVKAEAPPRIDGDLSDACWSKAPSVTDFCFAADGSGATEPTTTRLCYDEAHIYLAFECRDSQPDKIVAQQKKRGGDISTDDWVGFDLDCYSKYTHISWFDVSAGGVQVERLQTGDVSNIAWKGDWYSAVKRLPDGYVVEIAVPWSILQYDATRTSMGIAFIRRHARTEQWWWSPNVGPNTDARNFYVWEGLDLPRPRTGPQVMGYTLLGTGDPNSDGRAGLDMRYALTPSLTGLLTVSPDFRNIEQSVDSVDYSYTERYLSDSRPFFQQGKDHFPGSNIFYTRRIQDVDAGVNISGRYGDFGIAAMHAEHFGEEHHNVMQVSRQWGDHTWLWMCGIESHTPELDNTVGYLALNQVIAGEGDSEIKAGGSYITAGSSSNKGHLYGGSIWYKGVPRKLQWRIAHTVIEPDYFPYLGLVGDTDIRSTELSLDTYDEFSKGPMTEWWAGVDLGKADRMDCSPFTSYADAYAGVEFRDGTSAYLNASLSRREPYHDRDLTLQYSWGGRDLYRNGGIALSVGRLANGDHLAWSASQGWRITERLSVHGSYEYARVRKPSPEAFSAGMFIGSLVYDVDDERTVSGRIIADGGSPNLYLAYRQRVRRGTDAYVIFGDPNADSTRSTVAVKLAKVL